MALLPELPYMPSARMVRCLRPSLTPVFQSLPSEDRRLTVEQVRLYMQRHLATECSGTVPRRWVSIRLRGLHRALRYVCAEIRGESHEIEVFRRRSVLL
jgi:hypothetical protein